MTRDGIAIMKDVDSRGGAGVNGQWDLSTNQDLLLALRIKVDKKNKCGAIVLMLKDDQERAGRWEFDLNSVPTDALDFTTVLPRQGAGLADPNAVEKTGKPDLGKIRQISLMGDWLGPKPVDVEVDAVWLVPATPEVLAARADRENQQLAKLAAEKQQQQALVNRYRERTERSPRVSHVSAVAPAVLAIEIQAGRLLPSSLEKFEPMPGDKRVEKKTSSGEIESVVVTRNGQQLGWLIGPERQWLTKWEQVEGDPLLEFIGDQPSSYSVKSFDDDSYRQALEPEAVYRKSRANGWAQGPGSLTHKHTYYLTLPRPLKRGSTYSISLGELNTQQEEIEFTFDPLAIRSEAVHVNQIGYRPDDPVKRGFVSCWLGNGGRLEQPDTIRFVLVDDATGQVVFRGQGECHFPATKNEELARTANFNGTDVARCDFSEFATPGRYRLAVEAVGCSYPFEIGEQVWQQAFLTQMKGLYNQRSGVELGPPHTEFKKPRDMHPADGYRVTKTRYRAVEKGDTVYAEFPAGDTGEELPQAWGGYHDAGDWNPRRTTHMRVTLASLLVMELFPEQMAGLDLEIPATVGQPDLLTESLFEFEFFRRIQQADGGVPFTVESKGDPLPGEVSWFNSFSSYVTTADYAGSWYYASVGARLAGLLQPFDANKATAIRESAIRAFDFAEQDYAKDSAAGLTKNRKDNWKHLDFRNLAALELYRLTGNSRFHDVFLEDSVLGDPDPELNGYGKHVQREHAFIYARLPKSLGDAALKQKAVAAIEKTAERSLVNAANNAFNVTSPDRSRPQFLGFYTTPDASDLVYAHVLTGDPRYLRGIVQATQFQSGCNPNNWVYTTGLGSNPIKNAFKLDARFTGQPVPPGLTPYGNADLAVWNDEGMTWPIKWYVGRTMSPNTFAWPVTEAYWDLGGWPMLEEFTVDHWADNVLVWGYLGWRQ